jgi:hypothetical protein
MRWITCFTSLLRTPPSSVTSFSIMSTRGPNSSTVRDVGTSLVAKLVVCWRLRVILRVLVREPRVDDSPFFELRLGLTERLGSATIKLVSVRLMSLGKISSRASFCHATHNPCSVKEHNKFPACTKWRDAQSY